MYYIIYDINAYIIIVVIVVVVTDVVWYVHNGIDTDKNEGQKGEGWKTFVYFDRRTFLLGWSDDTNGLNGLSSLCKGY